VLLKLHLDLIRWFLYLYDTSAPLSRTLVYVGSVMERVHWVGVALAPASGVSVRGWLTPNGDLPQAGVCLRREFASGGSLPQAFYWLA
jgi:hypothetical protein